MCPAADGFLDDGQAREGSKPRRISSLTFLYIAPETGTPIAAYQLLERPYARIPDG
jgi:hypothetical protein